MLQYIYIMGKCQKKIIHLQDRFLAGQYVQWSNELFYSGWSRTRTYMPRRERLYRPPSQPIAQSTQNFCRFMRVPTSQWATTKAKSAGIQDKTCRNYLICLSPNEYIDCNQCLVWPLDRFEHIVSRLIVECPCPS